MRFGNDRGNRGGYGGGRYGGDRGDRGDRGGYGGDRGGYGGGGGGGFREAPVKVGEEHDLEITDVAAKGDGIGKVRGFIVFVPGAARGDKCRVRITVVKNRFAIGEKIGEGEAGGSASSESEDAEGGEEPDEMESGEEEEAQ